MSEPTPPTTRPVLASDAEREAVIARLHTAVGEGRLTADEAGERIAAVHTARYRAELAGPVADLPVDMGPVAAGVGSGPPSWEMLWAALLWRARVALDGPRATHPTPRRQRVGAVLAGLAVLWTVLWVALGAALA